MVAESGGKCLSVTEFSKAQALATKTVSHTIRKDGVTRYVVDTGSGNHLISWADLGDDLRQAIYELVTHKRLATANGVITIKQGVDIRIAALDKMVKALVMGDCPQIPMPTNHGEGRSLGDLQRTGIRTPTFPNPMNHLGVSRK